MGKPQYGTHPSIKHTLSIKTLDFEFFVYICSTWQRTCCKTSTTLRGNIFWLNVFFRGINNFNQTDKLWACIFYLCEFQVSRWLSTMWKALTSRLWPPFHLFQQCMAKAKGFRLIDVLSSGVKKSVFCSTTPTLSRCYSLQKKIIKISRDKWKFKS